jgi:zinc protease
MSTLCRFFVLPLLLLWVSPAADALELPPIHESTLRGGVRLVVVEDHSLPYMAVRFLVPAGSVSDPEGKEGVADMTARLLRYGTGDLDELAVAERIDSLGASFEASAAHDALLAAGDVPTLEKETVDAFLDLFLSLVLRPRLDAQSLEKERAIAVGELESLLDDNAALASHALRGWTLPGHPFGRSQGGTMESLAAITPADVRDFHGRAFIPQHAWLMVAGAADPKEIAARVQAHEGYLAWASDTIDVCRPVRDGRRVCAQFCTEQRCVDNPLLHSRPAPSLKGPGLLLLDKNQPGLSQEQFRAAFPIGRPIGDKDWFPFRLALDTLGGNYTARLNRVLRIEQGLTYGARLSLTYGRAFPGITWLATYTKPRDVVRALELSFEQLKAFARDGPAEEEHKSAIDKMVNRRAFLFETVDGVLDQLVLLRTYALPDDFVRTYEHRIAHVTPQASSAAAGQVYDLSKARIVVVGNASDAEALKAFVEGLGGSFEMRPAASAIHEPGWTPKPPPSSAGKPADEG